MKRDLRRLALPCLAVLLLGGLFCFLSLKQEKYQEIHPVSLDNFPFLNDDFNNTSLQAAVQNQLLWLTRQPANAVVNLGQSSLPCSLLLRSMQEFQRKLTKNPSKTELNRFLRDNYQLYQAGGRKKHSDKRQMLVTGYYEPVFSGDTQQTAAAQWPIYQPPRDMLITTEHHTSKVGHFDKQGKFLPYWTRAAIENNNLLAGQELAWLNDPLDAYLLHIQGSGKILLPDGSIKTVRFAGSNGLNYMSLGKLFVDKGIMPLEKVSIPAIRSWFEEHPEKMQAMLQHNPRFIFFKWGEKGHPPGSNGIPLTPGRSIAIDPKILPTGTLGFLKSRRPLFNAAGEHVGWTPIARFVFAQDKGAAIKGAGRVDLFWGDSSYAEKAASLMKESGELFFLVWKDQAVKNENRSQ